MIYKGKTAIYYVTTLHYAPQHPQYGKRREGSPTPEATEKPVCVLLFM